MPDSRIALLLLVLVAAGCTASTTLGSDMGPGTTGIMDATPAPTVGSCRADDDCVLIPQTCCGQCGSAASGDAIAVQRGTEQTYWSQVCLQGRGCDACLAPVDPLLVARCVSGSCRAFDLRDGLDRSCTVNDDCVLRCARGPRGTLQAVRVSEVSRLDALTCDGPVDGGPDCSTTCSAYYVAEYTTACEAGMCVVRAR